MMKTMAAAVMTVTAVTLGAQSDDQVAKAIADGLKAKGATQGLVLRDSAQGFFAAMNKLDNCLNGVNANNSDTPSTGFWLTAYTPLAWIRQQASDAAKEYRTMTVENVTEDMRDEVFRVFVYPDTPNQVSAGGMTGTASVQHVVLRDKAKKIVIQPTSKEPFTEESQNAMGAKLTHSGVVVQFPMDGLRELRGPKNDKEFFITVIGDTREEKNFEVKKKHFASLP